MWWQTEIPVAKANSKPLEIEDSKIGDSVKLECVESKPDLAVQIEHLQALVAAEERQAKTIQESYYCEQLSHLRNALNSKVQWIEQQVKSTAELEAAVAAHKLIAAESEFTIRRLEASLAAQATKIAELEELGRAEELKCTQSQNAQLETEKQNAQWIERHATVTAEFESKIAAHEHSATERDSTVAGLEASLAAQATKIAELEELGRAAELKCTQSQNAQLETEKQNVQLIERHATLTAEFESKIAAHEHSATERDSTVAGLEASLAAQATKIAELEEIERTAELRCTQSQNAQLETEKQNAQWIERHATVTAEFESKIAAHEHSAAERDSIIRGFEASLAAHAIKNAELEEFARAAELRSTQSQDAQLETEKQNDQLIERHATLTAEFESKIAAHEHSAAERDSTIRRLEASLAAHAMKIAELEEFGRTAELRCTQSHNAQLEIEKQNAQLIERHAAVTAELESKIAAHEHSAVERETTICEFKTSLAAQAIKNAELEKLARDAELRSTQSHNAQLEIEKQNAQLIERHDAVTAEFESKIAAHEHSAVERETTICEFKTSLAAQAMKIAELEELARATELWSTQSRDAQLEIEKQNAQLIERHAAETAEFESKIAAHKHSSAERETTIHGLEASLAAHAMKIAELEELARTAELRSTQSRDVQLEIEIQHAQLIERHATVTAELDSKIAANELSAAERETTIRGLEASLAAHAMKIAELEELGRTAELRSTQSQDAQLEIEKQNSQLIERHAGVTAELESRIAAHEHSAAERETTICEFKASLATQAMKIAELEELGRAAELQSTQSQDAQLETEKQNTLLIKRHATLEAEFEAAISAHEQLLKVRDATIRGLENLLDLLRRSHSEAKRDRAAVENRAHRCEQTIAQLQSDTIQLQLLLQREAAGRRKSESALKQALEAGKDNSVLQTLGSHFENAQRIDRLTNELLATRKLCRMLQAKVIQTKDNPKGTEQPIPKVAAISSAA